MPGSPTRPPDVRGMRIEEARRVLLARGFKVTATQIDETGRVTVAKVDGKVSLICSGDKVIAVVGASGDV